LSFRPITIIMRIHNEMTDRQTYIKCTVGLRLFVDKPKVTVMKKTPILVFCILSIFLDYTVRPTTTTTTTTTPTTTQPLLPSPPTTRTTTSVIASSETRTFVNNPTSASTASTSSQRPTTTTSSSQPGYMQCFCLISRRWTLTLLSTPNHSSLFLKPLSILISPFSSPSLTLLNYWMFHVCLICRLAVLHFQVIYYNRCGNVWQTRRCTR